MPGDGGPISIVQLFDVADPATAKSSALDFDKLVEQFNRKRVFDWTIPEAFLCLMLAAAMADGVMSPEEQMEIGALSRRSRTLKHLDGAQMAQINAVVKQRLDSRENGLREACEILPEDMRLSIFAHCVDIVLADGRLLPVELQFLNHIVRLLGITPADGKRMMEALLIKNQF